MRPNRSRSMTFKEIRRAIEAGATIRLRDGSRVFGWTLSGDATLFVETPSGEWKEIEASGAIDAERRSEA